MSAVKKVSRPRPKVIKAWAVIIDGAIYRINVRDTKKYLQDMYGKETVVRVEIRELPKGKRKAKP